MSAEARAVPKSVERRVGVVIVHGVGENELGYAVNTVAKTLKDNAAGYSFQPNSEVIRLRDGAEDGDTEDMKREFRVVRRRADHADGTRVTLDELHWADLTNLKAGRLNAMLGIFRVIFESHHLVAAMLDRPAHALTRFLRRLLLLASWLMRGPLAALTIATSAICAVLMFGPVSGTIGGMSVSNKFIAVQLILLIAAAILLFVVARFRDVSWYDTIFWLAVVTSALIVLERSVTIPEAVRTWPIVKETVGHHCFHDVDDARGRSLRAAYRENPAAVKKAQSDACYINGPYRVIAYGWRLWGGLLIASILLLGLMHLRSWAGGERAPIAPAAASIGIVILQFMLWTLIVVTVIFPMLSRGEAIKDLLLVRQELIAKRYDIDTGMVAKLMEFPVVDLDWIGRFKFVYGAAATTLVGFVFVGALIILRRTWVAYRNRHDLKRARDRMPELVFNGWLVAWLILAVVSVIGFIWFTESTEHPAFGPVKSIMLLVAAGAALLVPALLLERVSNGVHIARDLIDHHFAPRLETAVYFLPRVFLDESRFPRRKRIKERLEAVIENLIREGPWDKLVLVGHSQGSIVIFDYAEERFPYVAAASRERPAMISLGTPLGTIYRKYFFEYEAMMHLRAISGRLSQLLNLYRVDDYVAGPLPANGAAVLNIPMPQGGHMDYWNEPVVGRELDGLIRSPGRG